MIRAIIADLESTYGQDPAWGPTAALIIAEEELRVFYQRQAAKGKAKATEAACQS